MESPFYKKILLKLSGEALMGDQEFGISSDVIASYAKQIKEIVDLGVEVSIGLLYHIFQIFLTGVFINVII